MCRKEILPAVSLFTLALFVSGCGPPTPAVLPVRGTVTLDGQPLKLAVIVLEPNGARQAQGRIVDGQIVEVTTYAPGDGAMPGKHKVAIQAVSAANMPAPVASNPGEATLSRMTAPTAKSEIPSRYADPATSGLEVTIGAEEPPLTIKLRGERP